LAQEGVLKKNPPEKEEDLLVFATGLVPNYPCDQQTGGTSGKKEKLPNGLLFSPVPEGEILQGPVWKKSLGERENMERSYFLESRASDQTCCKKKQYYTNSEGVLGNDKEYRRLDAKESSRWMCT